MSERGESKFSITGGPLVDAMMEAIKEATLYFRASRLRIAEEQKLWGDPEIARLRKEVELMRLEEDKRRILMARSQRDQAKGKKAMVKEGKPTASIPVKFPPMESKK